MNQPTLCKPFFTVITTRDYPFTNGPRPRNLAHIYSRCAVPCPHSAVHRRSRSVVVVVVVSLYLSISLSLSHTPSYGWTEACGAERAVGGGQEHAAQEAHQGVRRRLRLQRLP